jgi:hypothetical protein
MRRQKRLIDEWHSMRGASFSYGITQSDKKIKLALALLSLSYRYQIAGQ